MTIKATLKAIRDLGLKARWSSEYREFSVSNDGKSWYYTDDAEDALGTARLMKG